MLEAERVTIMGKDFELGAIYGPRGRTTRRIQRPRKLVAFEPTEEWCGGRVLTHVISPDAKRQVIGATVSGTWWVRWAGDLWSNQEKEVNLRMDK